MEDVTPLDAQSPTSREARASWGPWEAPRYAPPRLHTVRGGGGATLAVSEAGDPHGPALLFVHGFSQCHRSWGRQFQSALALGFRLVALDLRGHGHSDKPWGAYGDGRLWAEDLRHVMGALGLRRPLVVAWSYGALVVADYLRHFGEEGLAGVNFVSPLVKLGTPEALSLLAPELRALLPGLFSPKDGPEVHAALQGFVSLLSQAPEPPEVRRQVLAYTRLVPPHVRAALGARVLDNDAVLGRLTLPVLVSHGLEDRVVRPASSAHLADTIPSAQVSFYPEAGHSPFREDARRFNRELAAFAARCWEVSRFASR